MNNISFLTEEDLTEAFLLEQASHAYPWSQQVFYSNQGERYLNLKISHADRMAGFAITQIILDEATLFNIAIHPEFQGQGYAYQLLTHLIPLLESRQVTTLWLEVRASNAAALHLYQKVGFNEVAIRPGYYPAMKGREDAIVMALII